MNVILTDPEPIRDTIPHLVSEGDYLVCSKALCRCAPRWVAYSAASKMYLLCDRHAQEVHQHNRKEATMTGEPTPIKRNLFSVPVGDKYEEKYAVFKDGERLAPGTYFVIRSSDAFAPATLYSYVHNIRTGLELDDIKGGKLFSAAERESLARLADLLVDLATEWEASAGKVPD